MKSPFIVYLALVLVMMGCSNLDPQVRLKTVNLSLDNDANLKSATAVDVVLVYKKPLLDALLSMQSADYFASTDQIKRDYPEMVDIWHWELTPGQTVQDYAITHRWDDAVGAFIFADYLTPGNHRVRVGSSDAVHIRLKATDFCVLEQGCGFEHTGSKGAESNKQAAAIRGNLTQRQMPQNRGQDKSVNLNADAASNAQKNGDGAQVIEKVTDGAQKIARLFK